MTRWPNKLASCGSEQNKCTASRHEVVFWILHRQAMVARSTKLITRRSHEQMHAI